MILYQSITKEEIYRLWEKNLMAELYMPFSPQSHQYCLFILDQCDPEKTNKLMSKIWNRFYNSRSN